MVWTSVKTLLLAALVVGVSAKDDWGYREDSEEQVGPSNWASRYANCSGKHQSPINLEYSGDSVIDLWGTTDIAPIKFTGDCKKFNLKTLEDLYKWELGADQSCKISLQLENGKTYSLAQFHVHTPSEHTINGHHYGGEIHFVHKEDNGSGLLVTGLLLNPEKHVPENAWIEDVWRTMNDGVEDKVVPAELEVNYVDLLNSIVYTSHLFNYAGSLTTPPCSEIVNWWVINNPLSISLSELKHLREKYAERPSTDKGRDNRPTQELNDRKVKYY
jgi:carbonic anhydrase|uniref:Carbonic anhydrase n=1 Tax=Globisporangium ultimum (strain ATCC 200006 / CBS 805.95 / DAOM BR144) TaxID=431595 RepID=K3WD24_GLOUD